MWLLNEIYTQPKWFVLSLLLLILWDLVWRGFALWYSAKNEQKGWFVALLIVNTLGSLPIIYLIWFKPSDITLVKQYQHEIKEQEIKAENLISQPENKKPAKKKK